MNYNHSKGKVKELKLACDKDKYLIVCLSNNGKHKNYKVHRLVAEAFILNPNNKLEINHINGDKSNNIVTNLEWCTSSENTIHSYKTGLQKIKYGKEHHSAILISQYNLKGIFIKDYKGVCTAARELNINPGGISNCLNGRNKTSGGFIWKYANRK